MTLRIDNKTARALWLHAQGLAETPTGPIDLIGTIKRLGFVQLDTIQVVSRAHHHILWSRSQHYREPMLNDLLAKERVIFEHFTHDASVIPVDFYPVWRKQFARMKKRLDGSKYYKGMLDADGRGAIKERIHAEGPLSTHAFDTQKKSKEMWSRPPHKMALDYMWYIGELSTSHRTGFTKYYDLTERVIPETLRTQTVDDRAQTDWLCENALSRLLFATPGEIKRFWDAVDTSEVKAWLSENERNLQPVIVEDEQGVWFDAHAPIDIEETIQSLKVPTSRMRILNPFDPVIRDRDRLKRLFGFDYRIEIFVPAAKRKWGYYVYPLLEGSKFVGRIEVKGDRKKDILTVLNLWPESGIQWTAGRQRKLEGELTRFARLAGVKTIIFQ